MAIIVGGTKVVPVAGDTLIIKDSADNNALKEIDFANIGVGNIVLTNTTLLVKTYTMYSDAGTANAIGTITVTDGVAGTGLSVPDYDNGKDYDQNEVVMEAGIFFRASTVGTNVGNAPAASPGNWDFIPIGGVATVHDVDAAYALNSIVIVGGAFFTPNVAIAADGNVAFVEGIAADEWSNILTVPFQLHDADALYANNDVVRVNNALFQANSAIDGTTTAVPFVEGVAVNEWRVLGSVIPVAATPYQAPIVTTITASTTHTFAAGCLYAVVEIQGAGAGGGRVGASSVNQYITPAGGAGGYIKAHLSLTAIADLVIVVGLAYTGVPAAGDRPLIAGGQTRITVNATNIDANGGLAAATDLNGSTSGWNRNGTLAGTTSEPPITDVVYLPSADGERGGSTNYNGGNAVVIVGDGGNSPLGHGGLGIQAASTNAKSSFVEGNGFGYGCAGRYQYYAGTDTTGMTYGGHGVVIITEYFS